MPIKGIATFTDGKNPVALLVQTDKATIKIDHSEKGAYVGANEDETEALLKAEMINRATGVDKTELENIWIHINRLVGKRQGEFVIATGAAPPELWPEEEDPDLGGPK